jgi:ADP-heptose:LPS heptosyltransferase
MRILALVPGTIGDQLLFFPTLDQLKVTYPDAKIDVVVEPQAVSAYQVKPAVSEVFAFDFNARNSLADWGNLLGIVRDREYEIVLAPNLSWSTNFLLWLSGIPTRVGCQNSPGANFLTATVPASADYKATQYADLLKPIGIAPPSNSSAFNLPKADLDWADAERKRLGLDKDSYVVIYSVDSGYPVNNWESILQDFQKKQPGLAIVLLQDRKNPEFSAAMKERLSILKPVQANTLGQQIAILAGASLTLCTEGDVLQAAIAAQTFTLGLFGSGDPSKLMPQSDRCLGIKSTSGKLADIPPASVLEKVWNN